jgi:hypothetical protein
MFITTAFPAIGQSEFVKEFKKEFQINDNTQLEISNKYGNVDIKDWNNESIAIEVAIKVRTSNKEQADKVFSCINIVLKQEGNVIKAITEFSDNFSDAFKGIHHDERGLEINYSVFMPKNIPLNLANKYGSVFINELTSTSTIDVKYGKLTANRILHESQQPLTQILLGYSNATIQECKWLKIDIKYSKMQISQSKAIVVVSKYSKIYIDNGSSIVSEAKYDTYELGSFNNIVATAGYTHFDIKKIANRLQFDTRYTDVIIEQVPAGFESIKINNSYGSYKIGIAEDASYMIDGYAKYCKIYYPEENSRVNRFNETTEMKINGRVGKHENPKSSVTINTNYGNIKLTE